MPFYLIYVLTLFLVGGCAGRIPEPIAYPYSQQQKMEASHHWQVLAKDLANRINNELIITDNINKTVFVKDTCGDEATACNHAETSSFNEAFRDLLLTNLVGFGIPTKQQKDDETMQIQYKVQIVRHNSERIRTIQPGLLTGLSAAIVVLRNAPADLVTIALGAAIDVANANMTFNGDYEIIITTSMLSGGKYLFRASDIYYINDKDFWQYQDRISQAKTMKLTSLKKSEIGDPGQPLPKTFKPVPEGTDQSAPANTKEI
ncbi:MAG: hypothetical protein KJ630_12315 [Proteobacteria bacterium]|nr:hypothetical protein [Pseudomonadota bacterium]